MTQIASKLILHNNNLSPDNANKKKGPHSLPNPKNDRTLGKTPF